MDASGQIPIAAYDGAKVRPNAATHRAAAHWPYAPDGCHLSPDQMSYAARCGCVTACHPLARAEPGADGGEAWAAGSGKGACADGSLALPGPGACGPSPGGVICVCGTIVSRVKG